MRLIEFTSKPEDTSPEKFLLIRKKDTGELDYYKTLEPLAHKDGGPKCIFLEESYSDIDPFEGVNLILKIRLGFFFLKDVSLYPIFIKLNSDPEKLLRKQTKYSVIFSKNVFIISEKYSIISENLTQLQPIELRSILYSFPVRGHDIFDPHSLANEWGPFRLHLGYKLLKGEKPQILDLLKGSKLLEKDYYWLILSLNEIRKPIRDNMLPVEEYLFKIKDWNKFCKDYPGLNILIIDDELDKGWKDILSVVLDKHLIEFYQPEEKSNIEKDLICYLNTKWDLVISDLRLTESDRSTGSIEDINQLATLSGIKVIKQIKNYDPSLPVIALTASNKAWTFMKLEHEYGIDGYWIKENPEKGIDNNYSLTNVSAFLEMISKLVAHNKSIYFLWDFIQQIDHLKSDTNYCRLFHPIISKSDKNKFIHERLNSIENLLVKGYGYLWKKPPKFTQDNFSFYPLEMAFIHIWGCINEALHLRYINNERSDCYLLHNNKLLVYAEYVENNGNHYHKYANFCCDILNYKYVKGEKTPPKFIYREKPTDTDNCRILLGIEPTDKEYKNTYEKLQKKRNKLDFIHGDSVGKIEGSVSIDLNDVKNIVNVIKKLLLINN